MEAVENREKIKDTVAYIKIDSKEMKKIENITKLEWMPNSVVKIYYEIPKSQNQPHIKISKLIQTHSSNVVIIGEVVEDNGEEKV